MTQIAGWSGKTLQLSHFIWRMLFLRARMNSASLRSDEHFDTKFAWFDVLNVWKNSIISLL